MKEALERLISESLDSLSLDLVELRVGGSRSRPVLDVRVDRRDGARIGVEDCARASRAIESRLEAGRLLGEHYRLEVSSPGVERALRRPADWRRFRGQRATVKAEELAGGGGAEVEIVEVEGDDAEAVARVRDARGQEHRLVIGRVVDARLAFHWNR